MEWLPGEIMVLTLHRWVGFQHKRNLDFKFLSFGQKETERLDSASRVPVRIKLGHWVFMCTTPYSYRFLSPPLSIRANCCASPIKLRGNLRGVRIVFRGGGGGRVAIPLVPYCLKKRYSIGENIWIGCSLLSSIPLLVFTFLAGRLLSLR